MNLTFVLNEVPCHTDILCFN